MNGGLKKKFHKLGHYNLVALFDEHGDQRFQI